MPKQKTHKIDILIKAAAFILSVAPPTLAVLFYFPVWAPYGTVKLVSGFSLLLLLVCAVPLFKIIKRQLESPTAYGIWFTIFVLFFLLSKIADEMCVISFMGFVGNIISAYLWRKLEKRRARGLGEKKHEDGGEI